MNQTVQIGGRIKRLRRAKGMSQTQLAEALDISASYLNLIEHNRRRMTVPLLFRVAGHFGVEPGELAESDDGRLVGDLMELFGDELFADAPLTNADIRDFAESHPHTARAVLKLFDRVKALATQSTSEDEPAVNSSQMVTDAVSDFLQENGNHFASLEAAADRVRGDMDAGEEGMEPAMRAYLANIFGIEVRLASLPHGVARRLDPSGRVLEIADTLEADSTSFMIAQHIGQLAAPAEISALIEASALPQPDAVNLARSALSSYFAAALLMPYEPFFRACRDMRYDIERVGRRFRTSFEQVCHRMTTLQRPGMSGIPLHLVRTDIAGNISKRFSLSGIRIPRHTGACPRWNIYASFLHPGEINIQISQMPDGERYFCIAKAITKGGHRHNAPRRHLSIGLGCAIERAPEMIYSDGFDLSGRREAVPIGVGCRICPRRECAQRAHPPADHRFADSATVRPANLYMALD